MELWLPTTDRKLRQVVPDFQDLEPFSRGIFNTTSLLAKIATFFQVNLIVGIAKE